MQGRLRASRLAALAALGFVLLDPPLLRIADRDGDILGIPVLYAYLFGVWAALIALVALVVRR